MQKSIILLLAHLHNIDSMLVWIKRDHTPWEWITDVEQNILSAIHKSKILSVLKINIAFLKGKDWIFLGRRPYFWYNNNSKAWAFCCYQGVFLPTIKNGRHFARWAKYENIRMAEKLCGFLSPGQGRNGLTPLPSGYHESKKQGRK